MAESLPLSSSALTGRLNQLAAFEPAPFPVISLYLNLTANQHGRDDYGSFVRKVFAEREAALPEGSADRDSFAQDAEKIRAYLEHDIDPAANGLALFACSAADLFEPLQFEAPITAHELFLASVPQLYPLARVAGSSPRYAAVLLDTNKARIAVYSLTTAERIEQVSGEKTRRHKQGGWSQARYQRHIDNVHMHHVKDVVEALEAVVREEGIEHIVAAGPDAAVALLREYLPTALAGKLRTVSSLTAGSSDADVAQAALEALREKDAETDAEHVAALIDAWRGGGLGVAGPESTMRALQLGQVDELLITGSPAVLKPVQRLPEDAAPGPVHVDTSAPQGAPEAARLKLADELVTRAQQTGARIRIIEDAALLEGVGGVGARLRFRL